MFDSSGELEFMFALIAVKNSSRVSGRSYFLCTWGQPVICVALNATKKNGVKRDWNSFSPYDGRGLFEIMNDDFSPELLIRIEGATTKKVDLSVNLIDLFRLG